MAAKRPPRNQRRRIFVACEGESERGYVAFLRQLADEADLSVYLDIRVGHGGDPLAIVEYALGELHRRANRHGAYEARVVFLDGDKRNESPDRTCSAEHLLQENSFLPVWSEPTLEGLLLRHFPGCSSLRPPTAKVALDNLKKQWPDYEKPISAQEVRRYINVDAVTRVSAEEPSLREFLKILGLLR